MPDTTDKIQLKSYNIAVQLLNFAQAWKNLVAATVQLPDLDLSKFYPFGFADFEEMLPSVETWCRQNASILLDSNPLMVRNPQCVFTCPVWWRAQLMASNTCSCSAEQLCCAYPLIPFDIGIINNALQHIVRMTTLSCKVNAAEKADGTSINVSDAQAFIDTITLPEDMRKSAEAVYDAWQSVIAHGIAHRITYSTVQCNNQENIL